MANSNTKLSNSEAGYLGYLASKETQEALYQKRITEYKLNPNRCKNCGKLLEYDKRHNSFCSRNCAATYNNLNKVVTIKKCNRCGAEYKSRSGNRRYCDKCSRQSVYIEIDSEKHKKHKGDWVISQCLNCGKQIKRKWECLYCDGKCQQEYKWKQTKQRILEAGEFDVAGGTVTKGETKRTQAKRFLEEEYGHKCAICGLTEWMGQPIPLVVDHIDGDPLNHKIENFRLVCGNCDMQLPTYKAKNKGKGRKYRRTLYQSDKDTEQR